VRVRAGSNFSLSSDTAVIDTGATTSCIYVPRLRYNEIRIQKGCRADELILSGGKNVPV